MYLQYAFSMQTYTHNTYIYILCFIPTSNSP